MKIKKITDFLKHSAEVLCKHSREIATKMGQTKFFKFINRYLQFENKKTSIQITLIFSGFLVAIFALWVIKELGHLVLHKTCVYVIEGGESSFRSRRVKPAIVEAVKVVPGTISKRIQTVGKLRPNNIVVIKSETNGRITEIPVKEDSEVKQGDILFRFDDADAKAELQDAEAQLVLRETAFKRMSALKLKNVTSGKDYDEAKAGFEMAKAKIETAKAHLSKTVIKAPFGGIVGLIEPSPGAYVQAGQELTTIVDNNPMKVDFKIPERNLHEAGKGQGIEVRLDGFPDQVFGATVEAIDSKVDAQSHSISMRASVPNPNGLLRGGMFANLSLIVGEKGGTILVPESAVEREGDIEYVWIVRRGKASRRKVLTGIKENNKVEISGGLSPDEIVVTDGQMRLGSDNHPVKMMNLNEDGSEKPKEEQEKLKDEADSESEEE